MNSLQQSINQQISYNQGKNLFHKNAADSFKFIQNTITGISRFKNLNQTDEKQLINYTVEKVLKEFYRLNQYYSFDEASVNALRMVYEKLLYKLKEQHENKDEIAKIHFENLVRWLEISNSFARNIYANKSVRLDAVTCADYSAEMQISVLHIDLSNLMEPILDVGCGEHHNLVNYLCKLGFEARGFDRFQNDSAYIENADWLKFNYGEKKWGTIISNMAFSNHFNHHHMRADGNFIAYAKKYMELINGLKIGGRFYYGPDLPFIETYIDQNNFSISKMHMDKTEFKTTIVKRLR